METLIRLAERLQAGDDAQVAEMTRQALAQNIPAADILNQGLIAGMNAVGEKFKNHELFLPDVLLAAKAMYAGMDLLKPQLIKDGIPSRGKVIIGSVQGDLHDIGKNLVAIMLKGAGYEIVDLRNDVAPDKFVTAAEQKAARVIGLSALLTTTMPQMKAVVDLVHERGLTGRIKVIIGGAPVTADYARAIGADAYGYDAANAVDTVTRLFAEP